MAQSGAQAPVSPLAGTPLPVPAMEPGAASTWAAIQTPTTPTPDPPGATLTFLVAAEPHKLPCHFAGDLGVLGLRRLPPPAPPTTLGLCSCSSGSGQGVSWRQMTCPFSSLQGPQAPAPQTLQDTAVTLVVLPKPGAFEGTLRAGHLAQHPRDTVGCPQLPALQPALGKEGHCRVHVPLGLRGQAPSPCGSAKPVRLLCRVLPQDTQWAPVSSAQTTLGYGQRLGGTTLPSRRAAPGLLCEGHGLAGRRVWTPGFWGDVESGRGMCPLGHGSQAGTWAVASALPDLGLRTSLPEAGKPRAGPEEAPGPHWGSRDPSCLFLDAGRREQGRRRPRAGAATRRTHIPGGARPAPTRPFPTGLSTPSALPVDPLLCPRHWGGPRALGPGCCCGWDAFAGRAWWGRAGVVPGRTLPTPQGPPVPLDTPLSQTLGRWWAWRGQGASWGRHAGRALAAALACGHSRSSHPLPQAACSRAHELPAQATCEKDTGRCGRSSVAAGGGGVPSEGSASLPRTWARCAHRGGAASSR